MGLRAITEVGERGLPQASQAASACSFQLAIAMPPLMVGLSPPPAIVRRSSAGPSVTGSDTRQVPVTVMVAGVSGARARLAASAAASAVAGRAAQSAVNAAGGVAVAARIAVIAKTWESIWPDPVFFVFLRGCRCTSIYFIHFPFPLLFSGFTVQNNRRNTSVPSTVLLCPP